MEGGECALKPYNNNDNIIPDECTLFVLILFFFPIFEGLSREYL